MPTRFMMLPPQTLATRDWGARLAADMPEMSVVIAEDVRQAEHAMAEADAAFGTLPPALLGNAARLRWLQATHAAPPAGHHSPDKAVWY